AAEPPDSAPDAVPKDVDPAFVIGTTLGAIVDVALVACAEVPANATTAASGTASNNARRIHLPLHTLDRGEFAADVASSQLETLRRVKRSQVASHFNSPAHGPSDQLNRVSVRSGARPPGRRPPWTNRTDREALSRSARLTGS